MSQCASIIVLPFEDCFVLKNLFLNTSNGAPNLLNIKYCDKTFTLTSITAHNNGAVYAGRQ